MKLRPGITLLIGLAVVGAATAQSAPNSIDEPTSAAAHDTAVVSKEELAARYPGVEVANIHDGPIPGFYEVTIESRVLYVTKDGRFLFQGDVVELATQANVTEDRRAQVRAALLAAIDPSSEIVFTPKTGPVKHRVTVFTDVDCGYCRQFHREIAKVNELGIEVRYVSYPRTGPGTESWRKAERVWCAADRHSALTRAKLGGEPDEVPGCDSTPTVARDYELGRRIGLTGTPALYTDSGFEIGGYLPPDELLTALEKYP